MDDIQELYHLFPEIKEHILVEKKVGQGTFSFVYVGHFHDKSSEKVALKYIIPTSSPSRTRQEIECLLDIGNQDNVIGVLAVLRNKSHILILMPYVRHSLFNDTFIHWSLAEIKDYVRNLLVALNRVHKCGFIHRDVKPSNFLYDNENKVYALVDFGLAQAYDKTSTEFTYETKNKTKPIGNENVSRPNHLVPFPRKSASSHLILTRDKRGSLGNTQPAAGSLPHAPPAKTPKNSAVEVSQLTNSASFDSQLNTLEADSGVVSKPISALAQKTNLVGSSPKGSRVGTPSKPNSPKPSSRSSTPTFQKFHSFRPPSTSTTYNKFESKCACYGEPSVCQQCTTRCKSKWAPRAGTAGFRAPEVLFRSTSQSPAVDVWSAGIIMLSLLSGRYPFFKTVGDNMAIMQLISLFGAESMRKVAFKYGESLVCSYNRKPLSLMEICVNLRTSALRSLHKDKLPADALTQFPDEAYDLLKRLLELDCEKRISAEDALKHPFFQTT